MPKDKDDKYIKIPNPNWFRKQLWNDFKSAAFWALFSAALFTFGVYLLVNA